MGVGPGPGLARPASPGFNPYPGPGGSNPPSQPPLYPGFVGLNALPGGPIPPPPGESGVRPLSGADVPRVGEFELAEMERREHARFEEAFTQVQSDVFSGRNQGGSLRLPTAVVPSHPRPVRGCNVAIDQVVLQTFTNEPTPRRALARQQGRAKMEEFGLAQRRPLDVPHRWTDKLEQRLLYAHTGHYRGHVKPPGNRMLGLAGELGVDPAEEALLAPGEGEGEGENGLFGNLNHADVEAQRRKEEEEEMRTGESGAVVLKKERVQVTNQIPYIPPYIHTPITHPMTITP